MMWVEIAVLICKEKNPSRFDNLLDSAHSFPSEYGIVEYISRSEGCLRIVLSLAHENRVESIVEWTRLMCSQNNVSLFKPIRFFDDESGQSSEYSLDSNT